MAAAKYSRYYLYIKPVIENKQVRSFLPFIFSLTAIIIFLIFAIRPTISTILSLRQSIENNKQVLTALNNKAETLSLAKNNLDNLSPEIKQKIETALPGSPEVTAMIKALQASSQNMASISALQVQPLTILDSETPKDKATSPSTIDFSYNIQGSYSNLLQILANLQKSPRIFNLSTISLNRQEDSSLVLSLTGKAYYLK